MTSQRQTPDSPTTRRWGTSQLQLIEGGRTEEVSGPAEASAPSASAPRVGRRTHRSTSRSLASRAALDARTRERGKRGVAEARAILEALGRPSWSESEAS